MGEHEGYRYPHDYPEGWVKQQYLPDGVEGGWFELRGHGYEKVIRRRLERLYGRRPDRHEEDQKTRGG